MTRVAAIDCGTNSVRLLIADISADKQVDVERRMEIVRLGEGVDRTGMLSPAALERTFAAMRDYAERIARSGAERVRVVATSATRDAGNRQDFVDGVREIFGVDPEVITGAEEARLSFTGATRGLAGHRPPYLVVDIGGGSTEFVIGDPDDLGADAPAAVSVDIGCVRLTERWLKEAGDPPGRAAVDAVVADIDAALDRVRAAVPVTRARTLVGLAGSVTTVAGIALGLSEYDPERIHHSRITASEVHDVTLRLLSMTREERAAIGVMHPGRVDVIGAGALILDQVMRVFGFSEVVVSEHDILDGTAMSLVGFHQTSS
ncbi:Ppx/GppA phosphatase family protein [Thermostaphylospora chromogena]|uniref:Exopolyphosphatase / guanosine-5'-triphosphate,3'-diphosphate pyrophosphatase n=1 Tax=Thermostaphylospora chromogena TaxID=35622 RepID=A0A1H1B8W0_9ACTN|nr:Ppx/GppA phosphatase family protein [Thermostaphylospora chromogena]SDQ48339.1 exopolyphosphatase / guanosine-5'-triphosphate,3'-diphosphate pyrophosphatase [Thermostaphylospora chromogena]